MQRIYDPSGTNPFGLENANPLGSHYGSDSSLAPTETLLLQKEVKREIFDTAPVQYNALKILYGKTFIEKASDDFDYVEHGFGRTALEINANAVATAASAGNHVTQTITLTAASYSYAGNDFIVTYPTGEKGTITALLGSNQVTVTSLTGLGLPAVSTGDFLSIQAGLYADGKTGFARLERLETTTRYNYVQFFLRAARWGIVELTKWQNTGTTDFIDKDRAERMRQLRTDLFVSFFDGVRGEAQLADGLQAKTMGGVYRLMLAAGVTASTPTVSGLKTAFEAAAFASNYKAEGEYRFVFGTDEILYELSKSWKEADIQYTPSDDTADLNLRMIVIGTMKFILVPCELFKEVSAFTADWGRRILVLDMDAIRPVTMRGIPAMEAGTTLGMEIREGFREWWIKAQLSIEYNNPQSGFIIDVQ